MKDKEIKDLVNKDLRHGMVCLREDIESHLLGLKALASLILNSDDEFLTSELGVLIEDWIEAQEMILDNYIKKYVPEGTGLSGL